jgi:hypothetical protein
MVSRPLETSLSLAACGKALWSADLSRQRTSLASLYAAPESRHLHRHVVNTVMLVHTITRSPAKRATI